MSPRCCLTLTALSGMLAVILGAFAAHGLKDSGYLERKYADVDPKIVAGHRIPAAYKYLMDFETGVEYQNSHSLALGLVGLLMLRQRSKLLAAAAVFFLVGIILFSGSLYVLVVAGPQWGGVSWGLIAPIGGTSLIVGWLCLALGVLRADYNRS
jgi:uncharacterized membrane protein YgdD (TMEM256/DUF423 family)